MHQPLRRAANNPDDWARRGTCRAHPASTFDVPIGQLTADQFAAVCAAARICTTRCPVLDRCAAEVAGRDHADRPKGQVIAGLVFGAEGALLDHHHTPCGHCGEPIVGRQRNARFCSPRCVSASQRGVAPSRPPAVVGHHHLFYPCDPGADRVRQRRRAQRRAEAAVKTLGLVRASQGVWTWRTATDADPPGWAYTVPITHVDPEQVAS